MLKKMKVLFLLICIVTLTTVGAFADSWSTNLKKFKGDSEVSTSTKKTDLKNYYLEITNLAGDYTSVNHWVEKTSGKNVSTKSATNEGDSGNFTLSTDVEIGDAYVLNVENPINTYVQVSASGAWSPN